MSFVKLYQVRQDSPISYQFVNQLADNQADLRTQLFVQHGDVEHLPGAKKVTGAPAFDYHALGRHDLDEIPRSVGAAALYLQSSPSTGVTTGINLQWTGPGIPSIWKVGDGDYLLPVVGLATWWAKVSILGGTGTTYLEPQVRPFYATAANGGNSGLRVITYMLDSGTGYFVPTDANFSIALYGTTT